jgi:hypothetical protein
MSERGELKWRDDYEIIGMLWPQLYNLKNRFGNNFKTPFDPHDVKYFDENIYDHIDLKIMPEWVRVDKVKEWDLTFDEEGNERIRKVTLWYFQTRPMTNAHVVTQDYMASQEDGTSA